MKYEDLEHVDPEIQKLIVSVMEKAELQGLNTQEDYEKFVFVLMREYARYRVGVDDLSRICAILYKSFSEKRFEGSELTAYFLFSGKDISVKMRNNPQEAELPIRGLIQYGKSIRNKLYTDEYTLGEYPFLKTLEKEERIYIAEYLDLEKIHSVNSVEALKRLFLSIWHDVDMAMYEIESLPRLTSGIYKLCELLPVEIRSSEFAQRLITASKEASKPASSYDEHSKNATDLMDLEREVRIEYGLCKKQRISNQITKYEEFKEFSPEVQRNMSVIMDKAGLDKLSNTEDFERYFVALVDAYIDHEVSVNELPDILSNLNLICLQSFWEDDTEDEKVYAIFDEGSRLDWELAKINMLGFENILNYAKELRKKYSGEPSSN